ncbi:hypothetical protein AB3Z07_28265 (plasmid) [Metabacillus halosaccharovorans]|uniref:hypothetical protein n=1 Tax=Metabacillus halosaccharovorans TaxID=930124 RepID=UPI001C1FC71F|nr:hypothetical protein [Metabacillus halosaccharovorans]MBU7595857.1 hypothetical protein [Metabacillus halosaccharovorans]
MNSALLSNGKIITAIEYISEIHSSRLFCIDKSCNRPVVFVKGNENKSPYFKTTGHNGSTHTETCGFYKPLDFLESLNKVSEYQNSFFSRGLKETIIRVNLNSLDPDREVKEVERESKADTQKADEIKVKNDNQTPASIGSLKSVVKLFLSYDPDVLSSIIVSTKGKKLPISSIIINQVKAHNLLWNDEIGDIAYFIFGTIESVTRRPKVFYVNFKPVNGISFTIVVFEKYLQYFSYSDEQLIGNTVLCYGYLQKNEKKKSTIVAIKSEKYMEVIKRSSDELV